MFRPQWFGGVLVEDGGKPGVLHHTPDHSTIVEMINDILDVIGEAVDVIPEVLLHQGWVLFAYALQCPVGLIREWNFFGIEFEFLDQLLKLTIIDVRPFLTNLFGLLFPPVNQDTFQPPYNNDGQYNALIFIGLKFTAQPLGRFPDFIGKVVQFSFIQYRCHRIVSFSLCTLYGLNSINTSLLT